MDEVDISLTNEFFGGDASKYKDAIAEGHRYAVSWDDIAASAVFPELEEMAHSVIVRMLGYLPHISVRLPFEPAIRAIGHTFRNGGLSDDQFFLQLEEHIKPIRNADMKSCLEHELDDSLYQNYEASWLPYGKAVKDRLSCFLGYAPELEHSLVAEMWLREVMSKDTFQLPDDLTEIDFKAINLIKYREILLPHGKAAADASPLVAMDIRANLRSKT